VEGHAICLHPLVRKGFNADFDGDQMAVHVDCYNFSSHDFFCLFFMIFSKIIFFNFYFLILSWLKITVRICEKSTVAFLANYCWLLQCVFSLWIVRVSLNMVFFSYDFFKIIFVNFIFFLILNWLRIIITSHYK